MREIILLVCGFVAVWLCLGIWIWIDYRNARRKWDALMEDVKWGRVQWGKGCDCCGGCPEGHCMCEHA